MSGKDAPTDYEVHKAMFEALISRRQSEFPGIVVAPLLVDGRVNVQPAIMIRARNGQQTPAKVITIPIEWPSWGSFEVQGKLSIGDEVIVRCMDKNWLAWLATGGVVQDLSIGGSQAGYATATPAQVSTVRRPKPLGPTEVMKIGRSDSLTTIVLSADGSVTIKGTELSMTAGAGISDFLTQLHTAIGLWAPVANDGGAALKTALAAWLALTPPTGGAPPPP